MQQELTSMDWEMNIEFTSMFGRNLKDNHDYTSSQRKFKNAPDHKNMMVYHKRLKLQPGVLIQFVCFFQPKGVGETNLIGVQCF